MPTSPFTDVHKHIVRYMSLETLQNPRTHHVRNLQFVRGIVADICGIVKGYPRNRQRVSAESSKGICEFLEGHPHSMEAQIATIASTSCTKIRTGNAPCACKFTHDLHANGYAVLFAQFRLFAHKFQQLHATTRAHASTPLRLCAQGQENVLLRVQALVKACQVEECSKVTNTRTWVRVNIAIYVLY